MSEIPTNMLRFKNKICIGHWEIARRERRERIKNGGRWRERRIASEKENHEHTNTRHETHTRRKRRKKRTQTHTRREREEKRVSRALCAREEHGLRVNLLRLDLV